MKLLSVSVGCPPLGAASLTFSLTFFNVSSVPPTLTVAVLLSAFPSEKLKLLSLSFPIFSIPVKVLFNLTFTPLFSIAVLIFWLSPAIFKVSPNILVVSLESSVVNLMPFVLTAVSYLHLF